MSQINSFRDLIVFQKAYDLSMEIFELTKDFLIEEKYSLIDQIRRSSRTVCTNIYESWAKRIYVKAFVNKLTDALGEEHETETWLNYSKDCNYLMINKFDHLMANYEEIRKMLISMIYNPEKFCRK